MNASHLAGLGSIALGAAAAVAAALGPLGLKSISFRTSEHIENQFIGGEVVSLVVVAPVAVSAGVLWLRSHRLAPVLALGPAMYAVYTYASVVLGQEYGRYDGNVERFFPLYAGLTAGGAGVAVAAWSALARQDLPTPPDRLIRTLVGTFLGVGGLFALAWTRQIWLVAAGRPPAEYVEGPTLFWTIKLFDCAFVIPLMIATGAGALRGNPLAIRATYGLAGFATCMAASVTGMAVAMDVTNDPSSQLALLAILIPATLGLAALTAGLLRSYATRPDGPPWGNPSIPLLRHRSW